MSPLNRRRLAIFKANHRGMVSLVIFCLLFLLSLFAEVIANDKPILVLFEGQILFPVFTAYPETHFGGEFPTEADYKDPYVMELVQAKGNAVWPPIHYSYDTVAKSETAERRALTPPSKAHWLGTDDQSRDVVARLIYGFRTAVLFGLVLTLFSGVIGVTAGAVQGFLGGWIDLGFQRFMEIWQSLPTLYLVIILSSVIRISFWWLLGILLLFGWMRYVGVVRAEFLRARNLDFVRAARALGVSDLVIMFRHVLPNAMVATITFLPFNLSAAITSLTGLGVLGFGLPPGTPSLGEMIVQGRNNIQAPWLGLTSFFTLAILLVLLIFVGEAVRDAFDPRKTLISNQD